jgi:YbgC/YbaW family acyl-CoA thioester hydrolase
VDGAGIVNFTWFFRYMAEAEHALWREAGLSIMPPDAAVGFPRIAVACEYHRPLRFEDEFDVCIRVAAIAQKTMRYTCALVRGDEAIADLTMTVVCVRWRPDEPMEAVPIPPEIAARFEVAAGVEA